MKKFRPVLLAAMLSALMTGAPAFGASVSHLERINVELVTPPFVHPHEQIAPAEPRIVEFRLTVDERKIVIDDKGTTMQAMMFNNSMPGPTMVVHEGDYVEITLVNPSTNSMPHNIDLHSATGALSGAQLTDVNPGEEATMRFKADRDGVFVYHCAPVGMVHWHVVTVMMGTVMVVPLAVL